MAKGYLKVNVYSDTVANPIKNATVTVLKNDEEITSSITDENGQTNLMTLDTVDKSYSLENQKTTKPYETYDVLVEALGLTPTKIEGVGIFDNITSIQNIYMTSLDEQENEEVNELPPNTLWGNYPEQTQVENNLNSGIAPIVLKSVIIPTNIIVHDGIPSNTSAKNYTVPFTDYIKNVASSEIYSTWPKETIKANVIAIISFTLNRIYTEWYRSRGYDFTITSTTNYDQKYTRNRTIFERISKVVDEVFTEYIRKGVRLEPLLARYKSETSENGILSQWGSEDLGQRGYTALEILRYYYGNDINTYNAQISNDAPYSFTKTLKEGDCSIDVYILQNSLNYIHGSYPGIPIIPNPTGYFDTNTKNAVKTFQKVFSLSQTGEANYSTWYKISYILTAVKDLTESVYN